VDVYRAEWTDRQRVFQAHALVDPTTPITELWFRTTVGPAGPAPRPGPGRLETSVVFAVVGLVTVAVLLSLGAPRVLAAVIAAVWGGLVLVAAVAPWGRAPAAEPVVPLLMLWPVGSELGTRSGCVVEILAADRHRLGVDGTVMVIGSPRPNSTFGVMIGSYMVWPQGPPRPGRSGDPLLGY